jgi:CheY-like chemotaxis protein
MSSTILVVDDEAPIRVMLRRILEEEGYDVALAADGLEAISYCERDMPALVILDIGMPHMDGYQFVEEFTRRGWQGRARVLVLSAQIRERTDLERIADSIHGFQPKPFEVEEILEVIRGLLTPVE